MDVSPQGLFSLSEKVAVVTGGATGIGLGITEVLAAAGATVVIAARDGRRARREAQTLTDAGHRVTSVDVDVAQEDSVIAACDAVISEIGVPWLLVNNAGLQDREPLLEASSSEWDRIHGVNARSAFLMTRQIGRAMVAAGGGGRIVNIASNALRGGLIKGLGAYATSKGAMAALSSVAAHELAEHAITVNTVLPAAVITPGAINATGPVSEGPATRPVPFGFQDAREVGAAVLYFASPAARPVTNQVLAVDGGFSVS